MKLTKENIEEIRLIALEIGGDFLVPITNELGQMEGIPHVWTLKPEPKLIVFTDQLKDPMNAHLYDHLPEIGFDTESHEWLTAKEFLKFYEDCKHIEFRALSSLKSWRVN
jgi:hypothetical protein